MAEIYGTIGILPLEEWDADTQYDLLNLVSYDGSSYVAHTKPPVGTLPTNADYWQISAQGAGKATAERLGVVKPDGTTTDVNAAGELGARKATQDTAGIVKGSPGIKVGADGSVDVDTAFTQATELANIIAGEAITAVLGKVSKAIATTMNLDQNALLKNMLTSQIVNDPNKIASMAALFAVNQKVTACNANYEQLNADFKDYSIKLVTESDCNTLINGSWIIQNPLNGPGEGWWLIQSFGDNNTRKQIGYDLHNSQPPKTRRFAAGTANVWENLKDDLADIYRTDTNVTVNLNSLESGFCYCNADCQNLPESAHGFCLTYYRDTNTRMQMYVSLTNKMYYRIRSTGIWNPWIEK